MLHPSLRRIALGIIALLGASWLWPFLLELAKSLGWLEHPGETVEAISSFLKDLWALPWFSSGVLLFVGFVAGLWADALLRRIDGSCVSDGARLGQRMEVLHWEMTQDLGGRFAIDHATPRKSWAAACDKNRPAILSVQAHANKIGLWFPSSIERLSGNYVLDYLGEVGRLLMDGHFKEAKRTANTYRRRPGGAS
jgi:hypothetical protein